MSDDEPLQVSETGGPKDTGAIYKRYDKKLGTGAYKDVFLAYDTENGIDVAWNTVKLNRVPTKERERIEQETRVLGQISHPNIIKFFNVWRNDIKREVCFTTEIVQGGTLKSFIARVYPVQLRVIKRWCFQILDALQYLHEKKPPIIHRDLKCENIFINSKDSTLLIGDFGLAALRHQTCARSVLGTPHFMAPELYDENYTEKVDIYAFGMCVLEMATNETPYLECANAAQIFKKVYSGQPPGVLKRIKTARIREFIEICLQPVEKRLSARQMKAHPFFHIIPADQNEVVVEAKAEGSVGFQSPAKTRSRKKSPKRKKNGSSFRKKTGVSFKDTDYRVLVSSKAETLKVDEKEGVANISFNIKFRGKDGPATVQKLVFDYNFKTDTAELVCKEMVQVLNLQPSALGKLTAEVQRVIDKIRADRETRKVVVQNGVHTTEDQKSNTTQTGEVSKEPKDTDGKTPVDVTNGGIPRELDEDDDGDDGDIDVPSPNVDADPKLSPLPLNRSHTAPLNVTPTKPKPDLTRGNTAPLDDSVLATMAQPSLHPSPQGGASQMQSKLSIPLSAADGLQSINEDSVMNQMLRPVAKPYRPTHSPPHGDSALGADTEGDTEDEEVERISDEAELAELHKRDAKKLEKRIEEIKDLLWKQLEEKQRKQKYKWKRKNRQRASELSEGGRSATFLSRDTPPDPNSRPLGRANSQPVLNGPRGGGQPVLNGHQIIEDGASVGASSVSGVPPSPHQTPWNLSPDHYRGRRDVNGSGSAHTLSPPRSPHVVRNQKIHGSHSYPVMRDPQEASGNENDLGEDSIFDFSDFDDPLAQPPPDDGASANGAATAPASKDAVAMDHDIFFAAPRGGRGTQPQKAPNAEKKASGAPPSPFDLINESLISGRRSPSAPVPKDTSTQNPIRPSVLKPVPAQTLDWAVKILGLEPGKLDAILEDPDHINRVSRKLQHKNKGSAWLAQIVKASELLLHESDRRRGILQISFSSRPREKRRARTPSPASSSSSRSAWHIYRAQQEENGGFTGLRKLQPGKYHAATMSQGTRGRSRSQSQQSDGSGAMPRGGNRRQMMDHKHPTETWPKTGTSPSKARATAGKNSPKLDFKEKLKREAEDLEATMMSSIELSLGAKPNLKLGTRGERGDTLASQRSQSRQKQARDRPHDVYPGITR
uniref:Protein kinase domain-containing protein n=2 Tax=Lotharella globosa TaxID=91324 RepID=A0A7S3YDV4_9EUKA|mmetsp:Transcript_13055/g.26611  ORF Transcript_13055/g.26611 Transcript_13055/m.26611 type:complete len:1167 (+) Transcript_13055:87-3587(+)|eukprot:CAMPEP_0167784214 /NCGR_PEP_ID=MMETSP0111_2-20121227/7512_1 /TAXON_ID=91324 /ORGANISM="Lotharella globosa, Strain CCCM811" /LENGTH=1166 /DNA_ID=CAMNT_0007675259 /DNA_START=120 /DNA_END=3620 /DNA_ORIENTATION=-